jgi:diaminohydroxyphosphoribosylaminopyrimidine deaminase/5-amino-6-(5-phosphoribosylamino)uracil reductase
MDYMARALELARQALGTTSPNPAVGAVIVKEGEIISQGSTQPPGGPHAEVVTLERAGERARGARMFVTLEPCCTFGRTPPCTQALIRAAVASVHIAALDPNPRVWGRGKKELEEAGITTHLGEHARAALELNDAYVKHVTTGLPLVAAKFAMSLDGKIATKKGDSRWLTGPQAQASAHRLRFWSDAVMVGVNTVLADDPRLTARDEQGSEIKAPLRVVVDSSGRTPPSARVFQGPGKVLLAVARPKLGGKYPEAEVVELPAPDGQVDIEELLSLLGKRGIIQVLVEGGGQLLGSLFDRGLVDKVYAFISPVIIGGRGAIPAVGGGGVERLAQAPRLEGAHQEKLGEDLLVWGYLPGKRPSLEESPWSETAGRKTV